MGSENEAELGEEILACGPSYPAPGRDGKSASLGEGQKEAFSQERPLCYQRSMSKGISSHLQLAAILESTREDGLGTHRALRATALESNLQTSLLKLRSSIWTGIGISFFLPPLTTTENNVKLLLLTNDSQISKYFLLPCPPLL